MKKRTETPKKAGDDRTNRALLRARETWDRPGLPKWGPRWLARLAETCNVTAACGMAGIGRSTVYDARDNNSAFAEAWTEAEADAVDNLEAECRRRALDGTRRPVYQGGKLVGHVPEYSDVLAMFLLKAHRPQKYRDVHELRGRLGAGVGIRMEDKTDEELERLRYAIALEPDDLKHHSDKDLANLAAWTAEEIRRRDQSRGGTGTPRPGHGAA